MKKLILLLAFILFFLSADKLYSQTYYQDEKGRIYTAKALQDYKEMKQRTYDNNLPGMGTVIGYQKKELISRNDSSIQMILWTNERPDNNENWEKIYSFRDKEIPEFKLKSVDRGKVSLHELEGKPVVIDFWFTSCKPCIQQMPMLNKLKKRYGDDVHFYSITFEDNSTVKRFLKSYNFDFHHLVDAKPYIKEIGVVFFPKTIIIDQKGHLTYIHNAEEHATLDELNEELKDLLR
jgi:cytochrome c biogenesis protein CcmG/thiol:disulfide interchange protein DsbE